MKKRSLAVAVLLMALATPAFADHLPEHRDQIIPGERIGPARLGMTRSQIEAVNTRTSRPTCTVEATYGPDGRAIRLKTNTGGACELEGLMVGDANRFRVRRIFGEPDRITEDGRYSPPPNAKSDVAYWERYSGRGIEFRFLVTSYEGGFEESLLQAIAVFLKK